MRKLFVFVMVMATLLTGLAGCEKKSEPPATTSAAMAELENSLNELEGLLGLSGSRLSCEKLLSNFEGRMASVENLEITKLDEVDLGGGETCLPVSIIDSVLGGSYSVAVYYSAAGEVDYISLDTSRGASFDLSFAFIAYFLYSSMELPAMESEDFYEHFKLLTTEPDGLLRTDDWGIMAQTEDTSISFFAVYDPQ